jgi:hypothetical protein
MTTTLSIHAGELRLTDGPECRTVARPGVPLALATAGTQFVRLEKLVGRATPSEMRLIGDAALRPSARAKLGYVRWKLTSARAFVRTLMDYAGPASGLAVFHTMRKIADAAGSGRWSFDGVLGAAGHTKEGPRLGHALAEAGKGYYYLPVSGTAPSDKLLEVSWTATWKPFKDGYHANLDAAELAPLLFAVAAANARGMRSVLVCCEPYVRSFDQLTDETKGIVGCHRFLLAQRLGKLAQELGLAVETADLDLTDAAREPEEEG